MGGAEAHAPAVAGLRNLGATCFFNSILQALASCQSLLEQLSDALQLLGQAPPHHPPFLCGGYRRDTELAAALLDCLQRLQPQPAGGSGGGGGSFAPRGLLELFRSRLPPGLLEENEEHCVAEALEMLCSILSEELQAAFVGGPTKRRLTGRASLAAVLSLQRSGSTGAGGAGSSSQLDASVEAGGGCAMGDSVSGACASGSQPGQRMDVASVLGGPDGSSGSGSTSGSSRADASSDGEGSGYDIAAGAADAAAGAADEADEQPAAQVEAAPVQLEPSTAAAGAPAAAQDGGQQPPPPPPTLPPPDPVLRGWQRARLPLEGSNAHELQCLACGHRSCVQVAPFWVLPLGIPLARGVRTLLGNVPAAPGACLEGCLASFYGFEQLHGLHCTRCSLRASLEGGGAALAAAAAAGRYHRLGELQQVVVDRGSLLLESEAYRGLLERAGLPWLPRPGSAAKRAVAATLPRVLCLQLRRGFWSEHGHVKVSGHVEFPPRLAMPLNMVPRLGHEQQLQLQPSLARQAAEAAASSAAGGSLGWRGGSGGGSGSCGDGADPVSLPPPQPPLYLLRAVVVHHGGLAGAGHYTLFRCLDSLVAQQAQHEGRAQHWARISDDDVRPASIREVLAAEASMLMYERCS